MGMLEQEIADLAMVCPGRRSRRASSWDRTGGNDDCIRINAGERHTLARIDGPGMITHIYMTLIEPHPLDYRDAVLRIYWDGSPHPSVEVPLGDFFCISNCTVRHFASLMMTVNPGAGRAYENTGLNCYFPMPFAGGAHIEIHNESPRILGGSLGRLWYHIDYEVFDTSPPPSVGRFYALWRRDNPTSIWQDTPLSRRGAFPRMNATDNQNYRILEAQGPGHVAGLFLQVDNLQGGWYGEGDDMIIIDDEPWPPALHGTGTEEVFGGGACPDREYAGPYTGFVLVENLNGEVFRGKNAMYRWYVRDPIRFSKSIRMSIEHGHANDLANDYSSVAYWYQSGALKPLPPLPPAAERRPSFPESFWQAERLFAMLASFHVDQIQDPFVFENKPVPAWNEIVKRLMSEGYVRLNARDCENAIASFTKANEILAANGICLSLPSD